MTWWMWLVIVACLAYAVGFVVVFFGHLVFLQMVTPGLAFLRALAWPIYLATGWPHGTPLPMD